LQKLMQVGWYVETVILLLLVFSGSSRSWRDRSYK
jgi:hypothetical protein